MIGKDWYFEIVDMRDELDDGETVFILGTDDGRGNDQHCGHYFPIFNEMGFDEVMEATFLTEMSEADTRKWLVDNGFTEITKLGDDWLFIMTGEDDAMFFLVHKDFWAAEECLDDNHIGHNFPTFASLGFHEIEESSFSSTMSEADTRKWLIDNGFTETTFKP